LEDTIKKETNINFSGLSDAEKMALYIYVYECHDMAVFLRTICNYFGWNMEDLFKENMEKLEKA